MLLKLSTLGEHPRTSEWLKDCETGVYCRRAEGSPGGLFHVLVLYKINTSCPFCIVHISSVIGCTCFFTIFVYFCGGFCGRMSVMRLNISDGTMVKYLPCPRRLADTNTCFHKPPNLIICFQMLCNLIIHSDVKLNSSPLQLCVLRKSHQNEDVILILIKYSWIQAYSAVWTVSWTIFSYSHFSEHLNEKIVMVTHYI